MSVSHQTVSKWEADEIVPELGKIVALSDVFSCKLDVLVREDLMFCDEVYSEIAVRNIKGFRMARYVMITPNPEDDVNRYMDTQAKQSGLLAANPDAKRIGWDFPYVPFELQNRFGLWGYVAAYVLPDDFDIDCPGVEYANQNVADCGYGTGYELTFSICGQVCLLNLWNCIEVYGILLLRYLTAVVINMPMQEWGFTGRAYDLFTDC